MTKGTRFNIASRCSISGSRPRLRISAAALALATAGGAVAAFTPAAGASTASMTMGSGTLGWATTPGNPAFPTSTTLTGTDQKVTGTLPMDVSDATGTGNGWNITMTSTTFSTTSGHSLSTSATTVQSAPTPACDSGSTCTVATNAISFPYSLPAGGTAPTATKLFDAAVNTGMGNETVTPTFTVAVPANTYAGTYTSTWTISLVSGP